MCSAPPEGHVYDIFSNVAGHRRMDGGWIWLSGSIVMYYDSGSATNAASETSRQQEQEQQQHQSLHVVQPQQRPKVVSWGRTKDPEVHSAIIGEDGFIRPGYNPYKGVAPGDGD